MKNASNRMSNESLLKAHLFCISGVCIVFTIIELLVQKFLAAGIIFLGGLLLASFMSFSKSKLPFNTRITIISVSQAVLILTCSLILGSVGDMFALFLASTIIAGIYFNKKVILLQAIFVNISVILTAVTMFERAFIGMSLAGFIKNIASFNIGVVFAYLLVNWGNEFMNDAAEKTAEANNLLDTVQEKMSEAQMMSEKQAKMLEEMNLAAEENEKLLQTVRENAKEHEEMVREQADMLEKVNRSAEENEKLLETVKEKMKESDALSEKQSKILANMNQAAKDVSDLAMQIKEVSDTLNYGTDEQTKALSDLGNSITEISEEIKNAIKASNISGEYSAKVDTALDDANKEMTQLLRSMDNISAISVEINSIIKTIETIAFQTNLLALNAAVEAARAGEAGKGFSVVADEVKNLATRCSVATKNTAELIDKTVGAINEIREISKETAEKLRDTVEMSVQSGLSIKSIVSIGQRQSQNITQLQESMSAISDVINRNSLTVMSNTEISNKLLEESRLMLGNS